MRTQACVAGWSETELGKLGGCRTLAQSNRVERKHSEGLAFPVWIPVTSTEFRTQQEGMGYSQI